MAAFFFPAPFIKRVSVPTLEITKSVPTVTAPTGNKQIHVAGGIDLGEAFSGRYVILMVQGVANSIGLSAVSVNSVTLSWLDSSFFPNGHGVVAGGFVPSGTTGINAIASFTGNQFAATFKILCLRGVPPEGVTRVDYKVSASSSQDPRSLSMVTEPGSIFMGLVSTAFPNAGASISGNTSGNEIQSAAQGGSSAFSGVATAIDSNGLTFSSGNARIMQGYTFK